MKNRIRFFGTFGVYHGLDPCFIRLGLFDVYQKKSEKWEFIVIFCLNIWKFELSLSVRNIGEKDV